MASDAKVGNALAVDEESESELESESFEDWLKAAQLLDYKEKLQENKFDSTESIKNYGTLNEWMTWVDEHVAPPAGHRGHFRKAFQSLNPEQKSLNIVEIEHLIREKLMGNGSSSDDAKLRKLLLEFWESVIKVYKPHYQSKGEIKRIYKSEFMTPRDASSFKVPLVDRGATIQKLISYVNSCVALHWGESGTHGDIPLLVIDGCTGSGKSRFTHDLLKEDEKMEEEFDEAKKKCFDLMIGDKECSVLRIGISYDEYRDGSGYVQADFCWRIIHAVLYSLRICGQNAANFITKMGKHFVDWTELNTIKTAIGIIYGLDGIDSHSPIVIAIDEILNVRSKATIKKKVKKKVKKKMNDNSNDNSSDKSNDNNNGTIEVEGWKAILSAIGDFYNDWTRIYPFCMFLVTSLDGSDFGSVTNSNREIIYLYLPLLSIPSMMKCIKDMEYVQTIIKDMENGKEQFEAYLEFYCGLTNGFPSQFARIAAGLKTLQSSMTSGNAKWNLDYLSQIIGSEMNTDFNRRYKKLSHHLSLKHYLSLIELTGVRVEARDSSADRQNEIQLSQFNGNAKINLHVIYLKGMGRVVSNRIVFPSLMLLRSVSSKGESKKKSESNDSDSEASCDFAAAMVNSSNCIFSYQASSACNDDNENDNENDNDDNYDQPPARKRPRLITVKTNKNKNVKKKSSNSNDGNCNNDNNSSDPYPDRGVMERYLRQLFGLPTTTAEISGIEYERRIMAMAVVKSWQHPQTEYTFPHRDKISCVKGRICTLGEYFGNDFELVGDTFAKRKDNMCVFPHLTNDNTVKNVSENPMINAISSGTDSNMKGVDIRFFVFDTDLQEYFSILIQAKTTLSVTNNFGSKTVGDIFKKISDCLAADSCRNDLAVVMSLRKPTQAFLSSFTNDVKSWKQIAWPSLKAQAKFFGPQFDHIHSWLEKFAKANAKSK